MTTVPPPTTPPPPPAAPAQTAPVVMILSPPPAVAALPPGTPLDGVVLPPPPAPPSVDGAPAPPPAVTIRTPQGDVTIRLPAPLPAGSDVELQVVRASADQATVRLLTVNDQPAAQVLAQLRQAQTPAPLPQQPLPQLPAQAPATLPPANAWTPQGPVPLPALGTVSAFIAQGLPPPPLAQMPQLPPAGSSAVPAQTPVLPLVFTTGTELAVRVTAVQLPLQGAPAALAQSPLQPSGQPIVPGQQQPAVTAPPVATSPPPLSGAPGMVTATPVIQQPATPPAAATPVAASPIVNIATPPVTPPAVTPVPVSQPALPVAGPQGLPPSAPTPPQAALLAPPQAIVTGVVSHVQPGAPPVIVTPQGEIQLNVRANLPVGTRVTLEITAEFPPEPGAAPPPLPIAALPLSGPPAAGTTVGWPNLTEAVAQLQRADPAAAAEFAAAIPDGGPRTTAAIIAFAQAMRSGDPRAWPGDTNLRALERAGPRGAHLAAQISGEVTALSARAHEGAGGEWRALPVPWNADGRIDRIALVTRREGDADEAGGGKKGGGRGTRFLINLDLSRLGALQLDGMFRKETRGFDLMIRTKAPLPDPLRLELTGVFTDSTAAMGLRGGLTFQVVKKFADPLGDTGAKSGVWA